MAISNQPRPKNAYVEFRKEALHGTIPARFETLAERFPDKLAVKSLRDTYSYKELNQAANRVACAILDRRGTGAESIAFLLNHDAQAIAAILGILKAGKFFVPLEPSDPQAMISYVLEDAQTNLLLSDQPNAALAQKVAQQDVSVLDIGDLSGSSTPENPSLPLGSDDLAYIFYTSGSTGQPKGVMDSHRNVLHNILRYTNSLHICSDDRLTLLQSFGFSGIVSSLFSALLNGAAVFLYPVRQQGVDGLASWLIREGITVYHSVPSIFRHMVVMSDAFPQLRLVRLEGDQASAQDIDIYRRVFSPHSILVNGLGATECGIVRQFFLDPSTELTGTTVPIGYPVSDMEVLVLDDAGVPVAAGDAGEIAIRSRYLARGYWRRPDLTEAAFRPSDVDGLRTYFSGDLGRLGADGCLEHLGRKDFQHKILGRRVDLTAVEQALLKLPTIKEAAAQTRLDSSGEPRLIAYLTTPQETSMPTVDQLRRHLADYLPDSMLPSMFVALAVLPLTVDGKLDRRALPAPPTTRPLLNTPLVEASTDIQRQLVTIWSELLEIDQVGIDDNFFELGGDSLQAVRVLRRVRQDLHKDQTIVQIFEQPTIRQFARLFRVRADADEKNITDENPLSGAQSLAQRRKAELARRRARRKDHYHE